MEEREKRTVQEKEIRRCLEAIEMMVKTTTYRSRGHELLQKFDVDEMETANRLHYYFVRARYHYNCYGHNGDLEHLESANDLMDHLYDVAYQEGARVKDVRYYFTRANVKREIAERIPLESRKDRLLDKARSITDKSLERHPENKSLLWLKAQLEA